MRMRLPCFFLLFSLLFLSACSKASPAPSVPVPRGSNYETSANISYRDLQATATISQASPSACHLTFSSPDSLTGLSFLFRQDTVDISFKGLSYTVDPGTIPGNAIAKMAVAAINASMSQGVSVSYDDQVLTLTGMLESGEFTLQLDKESGNFLKLSIPAEELEIEFINFHFLD